MEPGWQERGPIDRGTGLEFKVKVCDNDADLEFVLLTEAVGHGGHRYFA